MKRISMMSEPEFKVGDVVSVHDLKCRKGKQYDPIDDPFTIISITLYNFGGKVAWVYTIESNKEYPDHYLWIPTEQKMKYAVTKEHLELHPLINTKLGQLL